MNAEFGLQQKGENSFIDGPVMKKIVFMTRNHSIIIDSGGKKREEKGFILFDGKMMKEGEIIEMEELSVSFHSAKVNSKKFGLNGKDFIDSVCRFVLKSKYSFDVFLVENGRDFLLPDIWLTLFPRRFLDFNSSVFDPFLLPHGILGQTFRPLLSVDSKWMIEGTEDDYRLKDGFMGSDFTFNRFIR